MRLTERQREAIRAAGRACFGDGVRIWLFGSRTDDARRGGDIDLYVEPEIADPAAAVDARLRFLAELEQRLGEQRIDVVLRRAGGAELPIHRIARAEGVRLL